ncbi:MAG: hypothetical protein IT473_02405 [Lysobacter sp.]|nr:hypothetical protein [Lysobacter sp.]
MNARSSAPTHVGHRSPTESTGAQVHIESVRVVADGVSAGDAQRHAERLAGDIGRALSQAGQGRIRIGELSLRIDATQLGDAAARERLAGSVARRILAAVRD